MTASARLEPGVTPPTRRRRLRPRRIALHIFLTVVALIWLFPLAWAFLSALRPYADTQLHGYISIPTSLSFDNFVNAFQQGDFPQFYLNTIIITVPAVIITLIIASLVAFSVSRFSWRFNLLLLTVFTAGNLLPPQVIGLPIYRLYNILPIPHAISDNGLLYDQYIGVTLIHIAFQMGFCIFVLSNYMKTISKELTEAALVDGASVLRIWASIIMPLCRPAIAALAVLEFTFIYNDFFWALILMKSGDRRPITSALNNLQGQFFTDFNLLAAGALLAAIPTILVFIVLQKQFVSGLTLGATKG